MDPIRAIRPLDPAVIEEINKHDGTFMWGLMSLNYAGEDKYIDCDEFMAFMSAKCGHSLPADNRLDNDHFEIDKDKAKDFINNNLAPEFAKDLNDSIDKASNGKSTLDMHALHVWFDRMARKQGGFKTPLPELEVIHQTFDEFSRMLSDNPRDFKLKTPPPYVPRA